MKLTHIIEEEQNFLTAPQEIDDYIRNVLKYKSFYSVQNNSGVYFNRDLKLTNLRNEKIKIRIFSSADIFYEKNNFDVFEDFPIECNGLYIENNMFSDIIIRSKVVNSIHIRDNMNLKSITLYDPNIRLSVFQYGSNKYQDLITNKIEYKHNETVNYLNCENLGKLFSFDQIIIPSKKIKKLDIAWSGIKTFKDFDFHIINSCHFLLPNIDNYKYVDKIKCDGGIIFDILDNVKNIITFLLNKTQTLDILFTPNRKEISNIMQQYFRMDPSIRSEHVMDCAIDLIDAGYEKAAEL